MRTSRNVFSVHVFVLFVFFMQIALALVFDSVDLSGLPLYIPVLLSQFFTLILPILLFILITKAPVGRVIPCKPLGFFNVVLIFLFSIFVQPVMSFLSALSMLVFENDVVSLLDSINTLDVTMALMIIAIAPAVCEELAMRGVVMFGYRNMPLHKIVVMNGLLFGLLHLNGQQFLYAFFLGMVFAALVHYTGSVFSSILSHFVINGSQLLLARTFSPSVVDDALPAVLTFQDKIHLIGMAFVQSVFMLPILYFILRGIKRVNRHNIQSAASCGGNTKTTNEARNLLYIGDFFNQKIIDWALISIIVIYVLIVIVAPLLSGLA